MIGELQKQSDIRLTLFLRPTKRLSKTYEDNVRIIEGDLLDQNALRRSIAKHDIVFLNLTGRSDEISQCITAVMMETGVKRIIVICPTAVYETPLAPIVIPYMELTDPIRTSGLDYTIIRPTLLTSTGRLHYKVTREADIGKKKVVSQNQLFPIINKIIEAHEKYMLRHLRIGIPK